jgi:hypothetical protein
MPASISGISISGISISGISISGISISDIGISGTSSFVGRPMSAATEYSRTTLEEATELQQLQRASLGSVGFRVSFNGQHVLHIVLLALPGGT